MKIIVEVEGTWSGNCAAINELEFLKQGNSLSYRTTAEDSYCSNDIYNHTEGLYWNDLATGWSRFNLNDSKKNYDILTSTIFLYNNVTYPTINEWQRFLIDIQNDFDTIRVYLGGTTSTIGRTPRKIRFYNVMKDSEYNKETHLVKRSNEGLNFLGEISTKGHLFTIDQFDIKDFNIIVKNQKFLLKQNNQYYSIKPEHYSNGQFQPLTLEGGEKPNENDYENFGFKDANDLLTPIQVGEETFTPYDKLENEFEICMAMDKE